MTGVEVLRVGDERSADGSCDREPAIRVNVDLADAVPDPVLWIKT